MPEKKEMKKTEKGEIFISRKYNIRLRASEQCFLGICDVATMDSQ